ncbi:MAG: spermidine/putrescine ABC transporter substrate-binding protein [Clostridia bacterium]|nr:spermidine/putrescine ABC transporter substrate-binding protein [Clostridia bacterium]
MKRIVAILMLLVLCMGLCCGCQSEEEETVAEEPLTVVDEGYYQKFQGKDISINVYNWGEYIPDGSEEGVLNLNAEFTKLTGIKVNYTTYATNEELYAKLKGGGASYDIIIPSDYMISRMIHEDMLEEISFENIPNFQYIMEKFVNPEYDPENRYSVPYTWGTVGIIYDNTAIDMDESEMDWDILWDETYKDSILMFDNPRDAFAVAELLLGYSLNTENEQELTRAAEKLIEQKPVVQAYVMDEIFDKMGAGEAILAPYYAGDAATLMDEYDHLSFVIPKSGTNLFIDAACIPKGAKQKEAAEMYINFLCEPEVAYAVTDYIGYSTPNQGAFDLLDEEMQQDEIAYPDDAYITEKTTIYRNLSDEANLKMQELWTEMKSAETESVNQWVVPIFMAICILLSVGILIRRYWKNKKDIF